MPYDKNLDGLPSSAAEEIVAPATRAAAVTPSDITDLPTYAKALYVGTTGNIALVPRFAQTDAGVTFVGVTAGSILPVQCRRVLATGTTATNIVALTA